MSWYLKLHGLDDVVAFSIYLGKYGGHDWKKVMPQCLRIRYVQLKNESIPATWQAKTPEAKVAELLCTYGHGRTAIVRGPEGISEKARSEFVQEIHNALGLWLPKVLEETVKETESDPAAPSSPRDPKYYEIAAAKLANNRNIKGRGSLTNNSSIDQILKLMGEVADTFDVGLEDLYDDFRQYARQQAARQYEEEAARQDEARLTPVAVKAIRDMRTHQRMKLNGSGLKGAHPAGKFWLLVRSIDGMPILLVSSKEDKDIKDGFVQHATQLASVSDATVCTGTFEQDKKASRIFFTVEHGQTQTPAFVSALNAMRVDRRTVVSAPGGMNWH